MKRKLLGSLSVAAPLCIATYLANAATAEVVEIPSAVANPGNTITASIHGGEELTDVKVQGEIATHQDGVTVSDAATARDGNEVSGEYSSPNANTRWEVRMEWRVRGQVKTVGYVPPPGPQAPVTAYFMGIDMEARTVGLGNNWPALTPLDTKQLELHNENTFVQAQNAEVVFQEHLSNVGNIKFRYLFDLYGAGWISRGEMAVWVRGERYPRTENDEPVGYSWIKLHNTETGEVIIDTDEYLLN